MSDDIPWLDTYGDTCYRAAPLSEADLDVAEREVLFRDPFREENGPSHSQLARYIVLLERLIRYVEHNIGCPKHPDVAFGTDSNCPCGLDEASDALGTHGFS